MSEVKFTDPEVFEKAFEEFWPELVKKLDLTEDLEMNKASARKILKGNTEIDGYQLAKQFENDDWLVDGVAVEVLDTWFDYVSSAKRIIEEKRECEKTI